MSIYIYVEGKSDVAGLVALLNAYRQQYGQAGIATRLVPLKGKDQLLRKVGSRAYADLRFKADSHVIATPDLSPMAKFDPTRYAHDSYEALVGLLRRLVRTHAQSEGCSSSEVAGLLDRFYAFPLCHDLEVLLLAAHEELRRHLRAPGSLANAFRHPAEDQDDQQPPKRVVAELFRRHLKRRYRPTIDAPAVLRNVSPGELRTSGECPRFAEFLSVLERITGMPLP